MQLPYLLQAKEEGKEAADPVEPVTRTVSKSSEAWQVQNDSKPLWTRSPREVSHVCACHFKLSMHSRCAQHVCKCVGKAQHAQHACLTFEACAGTL